MKMEIDTMILKVNFAELNLVGMALTGTLPENRVADARELGMRLLDLRKKTYADQVKFATRLMGNITGGAGYPSDNNQSEVEGNV